LKPVFSSPGQGSSDLERIRFEIDKVPQKLFDSVDPSPDTDPEHGSAAYDDLDDKVPYLAGSFTGYQYRKMRSVYDFCSSVDEEANFDILEKAKANGTINRWAKSFDQLTPKEKRGYEEIRI
jgi:hypothetical protein